MLESIYIGLTGLNSFSRGLQNVSNNVANLNTPGFKSSSMRFADLFYTSGQSGRMAMPGNAQFGTGVTYTPSSINFTQGDIRTTSSDLDLAVEGRGFLALLKGGETTYTRTGQFFIDSDGNLSEANLNRQLGVLTANGSLQLFNVTDRRVSPPKATKEVKFTDNLSATGEEHQLADVEVIDSNGGTHSWTIHFKNDFATTSGHWEVTVKNEDGDDVGTGELIFAGSVLMPGKDKISIELKPAVGEASTVVLDFSTGVTGFSAGTTSSLRMQSVDGRAAGELSRVFINDDGVIELEYSNGETIETDHVALADFQDLQSLRQLGDGMFASEASESPRLGRQGDFGLGSVLGFSIEASNVDLSQEFGQLILFQRGYQASSQVISIANEMIQQLFEMRGRS